VSPRRELWVVRARNVHSRRARMEEIERQERLAARAGHSDMDAHVMAEAERDAHAIASTMGIRGDPLELGDQSRASSEANGDEETNPKDDDDMDDDDSSSSSSSVDPHVLQLEQLRDNLDRSREMTRRLLEAEADEAGDDEGRLRADLSRVMGGAPPDVMSVLEDIEMLMRDLESGPRYNAASHWGEGRARGDSLASRGEHQQYVSLAEAAGMILAESALDSDSDSDLDLAAILNEFSAEEPGDQDDAMLAEELLKRLAARDTGEGNVVKSSIDAVAKKKHRPVGGGDTESKARESSPIRMGDDSQVLNLASVVRHALAALKAARESEESMLRGPKVSASTLFPVLSLEQGRPKSKSTGTGLLILRSQAADAPSAPILRRVDADPSAIGLEWKDFSVHAVGEDEGATEGEDVMDAGIIKVQLDPNVSGKLKRASEAGSGSAGHASCVAGHSNFFVVGTSKGVVMLFEPRRGTFGGALGAASSDAVTTVCINAQGDHVAVGYASGKVAVWAIAMSHKADSTPEGKTGYMVREVKTMDDLHSVPVNHVAFISSAVGQLEFWSSDRAGVLNVVTLSHRAIVGSWGVSPQKVLDRTKIGPILHASDLHLADLTADLAKNEMAPNSALRLVGAANHFVAIGSRQGTFILGQRPEWRTLCGWKRPDEAPPDCLPVHAWSVSRVAGTRSAAIAEKEGSPTEASETAPKESGFLPGVGFAAPVLARGWGKTLQLLQAQPPEGYPDAFTQRAKADAKKASATSRQSADSLAGAFRTAAGRDEEAAAKLAFVVTDELEAPAIIVALAWVQSEILAILTSDGALTFVDVVSMQEVDSKAARSLHITSFAMPIPAPSGKAPVNAPCFSGSVVAWPGVSGQGQLMLLGRAALWHARVQSWEERVKALLAAEELMPALSLALLHHQTVRAENLRWFEFSRRRARAVAKAKGASAASVRGTPRAEELIPPSVQTAVESVLLSFLSRFHARLEDREAEVDKLKADARMLLDAAAVEGSEASGGGAQSLHGRATKAMRDAAHAAQALDLEWRRLARASAEFCVAIGAIDLLFTKALGCFVEVKREPILLDTLEPFIMEGKLRSMPPGVLQSWIAHCDARGRTDIVQRCLVRLLTASSTASSSADLSDMSQQPLDTNTVIHLTARHGLWTAAVVVHTRTLLDPVTPLDLLLCASITPYWIPSATLKYTDATSSEQDDPQRGKLRCTRFDVGRKALLFVDLTLDGRGFPDGAQSDPDKKLRIKLLRGLLDETPKAWPDVPESVINGSLTSLMGEEEESDSHHDSSAPRVSMILGRQVLTSLPGPYPRLQALALLDLQTLLHTLRGWVTGRAQERLQEPPVEAPAEESASSDTDSSAGLGSDGSEAEVVWGAIDSVMGSIKPPQEGGSVQPSELLGTVRSRAREFGPGTRSLLLAAMETLCQSHDVKGVIFPSTAGQEDSFESLGGVIRQVRRRRLAGASEPSAPAAASAGALEQEARGNGLGSTMQQIFGSHFVSLGGSAAKDSQKQPARRPHARAGGGFSRAARELTVPDPQQVLDALVKGLLVLYPSTPDSAGPSVEATSGITPLSRTRSLILQGDASASAGAAASVSGTRISTSEGRAMLPADSADALCMFLAHTVVTQGLEDDEISREASLLCLRHLIATTSGGRSWTREGDVAGDADRALKRRQRLICRLVRQLELQPTEAEPLVLLAEAQGLNRVCAQLRAMRNEVDAAVQAFLREERPEWQARVFRFLRSQWRSAERTLLEEQAASKDAGKAISRRGGDATTSRALEARETLDTLRHAIDSNLGGLVDADPCQAAVVSIWTLPSGEPIFHLLGRIADRTDRQLALLSEIVNADVSRLQDERDKQKRAAEAGSADLSSAVDIGDAMDPQEFGPSGELELGSETTVRAALHHSSVVAGPDVHLLYLQLLVKHRPRLVYKYLQSTEAYRVEEALAEVRGHPLVADAYAYLLERTEQQSQALELVSRTIQQQLESVSLKVAEYSLRNKLGVEQEKRRARALEQAGVLDDRGTVEGAAASSAAAASGSAMAVTMSASVPAVREADEELLSLAQQIRRDCPEAAVAERAARRIHRFAVHMCNRASANRSKGAQELWYRLMDTLAVREKELLRQRRPLSNAESKRGPFGADTAVEVAVAQNMGATAAWQVASAMLSMTLKAIQLRLPLHTVLEKVLTDHDTARFADFAPLIVSLVEGQVFELNLRKTATKLLARDVSAAATTFIRASSRFVRSVRGGASGQTEEPVEPGRRESVFGRARAGTLAGTRGRAGTIAPQLDDMDDGMGALLESEDTVESGLELLSAQRKRRLEQAPLLNVMMQLGKGYGTAALRTVRLSGAPPRPADAEQRRFERLAMTTE
jgi:hypothetical protein